MSYPHPMDVAEAEDREANKPDACTEINRILREKYEARRIAGEVRATGRRPRFTPEEAAKLVADRQAGRSIMSLAREHRTSQSVIAKYIRYGFKPARWTA